FGTSIEPVWIIGAVTMKITSRTSITSMYGTTLIWFIRRRWRMGDSLPCSAQVTLQDVRELFHEALETDADAVDVVREAVVGHDSRSGGEQADGGRHQCFCNAWRDQRERRAADVGQAAEGIHDPPYGTEQADVRSDRA